MRPALKVLWPLALVCLGLGSASAKAQAPERLDPFVHANLVHTLYHELAHGLIDQFAIPVLGQEEDAADNFATLEMRRIHGRRAKSMIADVAMAWLMADAAIDRDTLDLHGEHDLDAQRAFRAVCLYTGLGHQGDLDLAEWVGLPEDSHDTCAQTATQNRDSWRAALAPTLRQPGDPLPDVSLTFRPTFWNVEQKTLLEESGVLQAFVRDIATRFAWPAPISVMTMSCDEANAFWDPETRQIEICYEIIDEWVDYAGRDPRAAHEMFRQGTTRITTIVDTGFEKNIRP